MNVIKNSIVKRISALLLLFVMIFTEVLSEPMLVHADSNQLRETYIALSKKQTQADVKDLENMTMNDLRVLSLYLSNFYVPWNTALANTDTNDKVIKEALANQLTNLNFDNATAQKLIDNIYAASKQSSHELYFCVEDWVLLYCNSAYKDDSNNANINICDFFDRLESSDGPTYILNNKGLGINIGMSADDGLITSHDNVNRNAGITVPIYYLIKDSLEVDRDTPLYRDSSKKIKDVWSQEPITTLDYVYSDTNGSKALNYTTIRHPSTTWSNSSAGTKVTIIKHYIPMTEWLFNCIISMISLHDTTFSGKTLYASTQQSYKEHFVLYTNGIDDSEGVLDIATGVIYTYDTNGIATPTGGSEADLEKAKQLTDTTLLAMQNLYKYWKSNIANNKSLSIYSDFSHFEDDIDANGGGETSEDKLKTWAKQNNYEGYSYSNTEFWYNASIWLSIVYDYKFKGGSKPQKVEGMTDDSYNAFIQTLEDGYKSVESIVATTAPQEIVGDGVDETEALMGTRKFAANHGVDCFYLDGNTLADGTPCIRLNYKMQQIYASSLKDLKAADSKAELSGRCGNASLVFTTKDDAESIKTLAGNKANQDAIEDALVANSIFTQKMYVDWVGNIICAFGSSKVIVVPASINNCVWSSISNEVNGKLPKAIYANLLSVQGVRFRLNCSTDNDKKRQYLAYTYENMLETEATLSKEDWFDTATWVEGLGGMHKSMLKHKFGAGALTYNGNMYLKADKAGTNYKVGGKIKAINYFGSLITYANIENANGLTDESIFVEYDMIAGDMTNDSNLFKPESSWISSESSAILNYTEQKEITLLQDMFVTYVFAYNNKDKETYTRGDCGINLKFMAARFPLFDGAVSFAQDAESQKEARNEELLGFAYYLLHPTKGLSYVATLIKNKLSAVLINWHEDIVGSSDSNSTTGMTQYLGINGYVTTPNLYDIGWVAWLLDAYDAIIVYLLILICLIILCYVIIGNMTIQRGIIGAILFGVLAFLPPVAINAAVDVSNTVCDRIYSDKFNYWAICQLQTYLGNLHDVVTAETTEDYVTALMNIRTNTQNKTNVGGQSETFYSGVKVKWMTPKKFNEMAEAEKTVNNSLVSTSDTLNNIVLNVMDASSNAQEYLDSDNALYLYRDYCDIYMYASVGYNLYNITPSLLNDTLLSPYDVLKPWTESGSTTLSTLTYSSGKSIKNYLISNNPSASSYSSVSEDIKDTSSLKAIERGFLVDTVGVGDGNDTNYYGDRSAAISEYLRYGQSLLDIINSSNRFNNFIAENNNTVVINNKTLGEDFGSNSSIYFGFNPKDLTLTLNDLSLGYEVTDSSYKDLSYFYYALYAESPFYYFNANVRDQVNSLIPSYSYSYTSPDASVANMKSMFLNYNQDYFYNYSENSGEGFGELKDFMNMHDFFYYLMPTLQKGNDLVNLFDNVYTMNEFTDINLKITKGGSIMYDGVNYASIQEMKDLNVFDEMDDETKYKFWHNFNVYTLFSMYVTWLDTMNDCDYAKPQNIEVLGEKFRVENPLDPTSYYITDTSGNITEGRYMIFSRSEQKYYGLKDTDLTTVEQKILKVQDKVYKNSIDLMNYYTMSDETIIQAFAMLELFEFNKEFSQTSLISDDYILYPQGYELKAFTYDAYLRLILSGATGDSLMQNMDTSTTTDSRSTSTDGTSTDGENTDGESTDGESTDGESTDGNETGSLIDKIDKVFTFIGNKLNPLEVYTVNAGGFTANNTTKSAWQSQARAQGISFEQLLVEKYRASKHDASSAQTSFAQWLHNQGIYDKSKLKPLDLDGASQACVQMAKDLGISEKEAKWKLIYEKAKNSGYASVDLYLLAVGHDTTYKESTSRDSMPTSVAEGLKPYESKSSSTSSDGGTDGGSDDSSTDDPLNTAISVTDEDDPISTSIYTRIIKKTSIFFGVILLINDLVACYAIPGLKLFIIILLFFMSVALIIAEAFKLEFNFLNVLWKSLIAPLLAYLGVSIGMAFIVSLFMTNGAVGVTGQYTLISLGDPTMTLLVMLIINIVALILYWKIFKKGWHDFKVYMKAIANSVTEATTGAASKMMSVATGALAGGVAALGFKRAMKSMGAGSGSSDSSGESRGTGESGGGISNSGEGGYSTAESRGTDNVNAVNPQPQYNPVTPDNVDEKEDQAELDKWNNKAAEFTNKNRADKSNIDNVNSQVKKTKMEQERDLAKSASERAEAGKAAWHNKDLGIKERVSGAKDAITGSVSAKFNGAKANVRSTLTHGTGQTKLDRLINGTGENRGLTKEQVASRDKSRQNLNDNIKNEQVAKQRATQQAETMQRNREVKSLKRTEKHGYAFSQGMSTQKGNTLASNGVSSVKYQPQPVSNAVASKPTGLKLKNG